MTRDEVRAELQAEVGPAWHIWLSERGSWWATGPEWDWELGRWPAAYARTVGDVKTPDELRILIAAQNALVP